MKLTQKACDALTLPAGKTDHFEWDDTAKGFGYRLRLGAGDKVLRSWVVQYRHGGATRRMRLKAAVLQADRARKEAKKILAEVELGKDPQEDKQDRRNKDRHTFAATVTDYLAFKKPKVRERTYVELQRYLTDKVYFGPLHSKPIDRIKRADVAVLLDSIGDKHTSIVAQRGRSQLSALFAWAVGGSRCEANPVTGTEQPDGGKPRDRALTDDELRRVWNACADDDYGKIIKLLLLSGCRRQEVGSMCWSEFDFEKGVWTLPAARSKNHRAHSLPLMPMMSSIIKTIPRMASRDALFGVRASGFTLWSEGKAALDARLDGMVKFKIHDLRRTVATGMADLSIAPHIIEAVLNHQSGHKGGVSGVYNRSSYQREVRIALGTWHDHLDALIAGRERSIINLQQAAS